MGEIQTKLLTENKLIICALWKLQYQISKEKFVLEPGSETGCPDLALYQFSYSGSAASACLNMSLDIFLSNILGCKF